VTVAEKKELAQLKAEVATQAQEIAALARMLLNTHGAHRSLIAILERHSPEGREIRPASAPEQREAVRV
jgi:hypothetical protein